MKSKLSLLALAFLTACGGGGGSSPSTPTTPFPTVTINTSATKVFTGESIKINWSSTNATTCAPTEGFIGVQPISGELNFTPTKSGTYRYALSCTGDGRTGTNAVIIVVEDIIKTFSGSLSKDKITSANFFGNYNTSIGSFMFTTGVWNATASTSHAASISGTVDVKNQKILISQFDWDAVSSLTPGVVMFSNFTIGKHPGTSTSSSSKFPVLISDLKPLMATGNIQTICLTVCRYGTILDIFVMKNANATPQEVGLEIIVSLDNTGGEPQQQFYVGQLTVNNITFNVYRNAFGGNFDTTWNNVIYRAPRGTSYTNMQLDLSAFVKDSVTRGYAKNSDYLMSVELGTEVIHGKGQTLVNDFSLN